MIEQKVRRLGCSHDECVQRLHDYAERAFEAGDIEKVRLYMEIIRPDAPADLPQTLALNGTDFS